MNIDELEKLAREALRDSWPNMASQQQRGEIARARMEALSEYWANMGPMQALRLIERLRDAEEAMRQASNDLYHGPIGQPYESERMIDSYFEKWGNDQ